MIANTFVTSESSFIDMEAWDACIDIDAKPVVAFPSLPVWVGVDASVKHDSTAIVAVTWDQDEQKVRLIAHRIFQPSPTEPLDFEAPIESTLTELAQRFTVRKVLFDPYQMAATAQRLARQGITIEEFPQSTPNLTAASQNLYELINGRNLVAYPDPAMRLAISRAVAIESSRGWRITKEKQSHKIDVVVALAMAAFAAIKTGESRKISWSAVAGNTSFDSNTGKRHVQHPSFDPVQSTFGNICYDGSTSKSHEWMTRSRRIPTNADYLKDGGLSKPPREE
jgi:phage terminase large subunit-like protein